MALTVAVTGPTGEIGISAVGATRPRRLVYTSSVAAYGYHADNPLPLTEDVSPRGSAEHYYSEQKAACEAALRGVAGVIFALAPLVPDPGIPLQLIHHDDVAAAIALAAHGAGKPGAYNL